MSKEVTYEQARQLKRLNFRRRSRAYYVDGNLDYNNPINWNTNEGLDENGEYQEEDGYCSAPTVSDALDFIRDERGVRCAVELFGETNRFGDIRGYKYSGAYIKKDNKQVLLDPTETYSEAENALLNALLEYLEKGILNKTL